jgi:hypothetical protein
MRRTVVVTVLLSSLLPQIVFAQEQPPLQADVQLRVDSNNRRLASFNTVLEGGEATLRGTAQNLPGGETVFFTLRFDYRTKADIALDELISQIVISTRDRARNEFSRAIIDPNTAPLNPNRAPLDYSATLYRPPRSNRGSYTVRIQVFGNYE